MSRESVPDPPRRPAVSLKPSPIRPVPEETARVARAAFRKGNPLLKFRDDLPDRRAAEAVRARIDWKYALGLELADPGFDASVLCEFRARLVEGAAEERLLARCRELGLVKARGRQ